MQTSIRETAAERASRRRICGRSLALVALLSAAALVSTGALARGEPTAAGAVVAQAAAETPNPKLKNSGGYAIGVYYYPGWKSDDSVDPPKHPWEKIQAYPEREPLLGWYQDGSQDVIDQQVRWMHDYGVKFVVFDWYWTSNRPRIEHALDAYLLSKNKNLVQFAIVYCNHENYPKNEKDWLTITQYWVDHFLKDSQYQRIGGKPVVHIFSPQDLEKKAARFGMTTAQLLAESQDIAKKAGLPGILFVAGTPAGDFAQNIAPQWGYEALSGYNYSAGRTIKGFDSYESLTRGYQEHWDWLLQNASLPYFIVMSAGWDKRPWGGSKDPRRDQSSSTPDSFELQLRAAKATMDRYPDKSLRTGVICCWNEYGEGSYMEPTKRYGMQYLERIRTVFGK